MCTVVHMSTYEFHRDGIEPLGLPAWLAEIMTEILEYVPEMSVPIDAAISMYLDADATGYGGKWSKTVGRGGRPVHRAAVEPRPSRVGGR